MMDNRMKVLVTGAAGFIGAAVCRRLVELHYDVVGVDNINDYYDPRLKFSRLQMLGVGSDAENWGLKVAGVAGFAFIRLNLEDEEGIARIFEDERPDYVIHLAAQAGVRYSITNPRAYIKSNIDGFLNVIEGCRTFGVKHFVYASSSSVYGLNSKVPFSEHDGIAHPVSLYAATKKSDELIAHAYAKLYNIPSTGLRFFTVYGPWGRPDMSPFLFIDAILNDRPIKVFNNGDMLRDFTYIDDVVESVTRILSVIPHPNAEWDEANPDPASSPAPYIIYNVGNQSPTRLMNYIECIEQAAGKEALKEFLPMQPGDVYQTYADSSALQQATGFRPSTPLTFGIAKTVEWFRDYFGK